MNRSIPALVLATGVLTSLWAPPASSTLSWLETDCIPVSVTELTNGNTQVVCSRVSDGTAPGTIHFFVAPERAFNELAQTARASGATLRLGYHVSGAANVPGCLVSDCRTPSMFGLITAPATACRNFNPLTTDTNAKNDFCADPACPCHVLEGDCDNDNECVPGLVCRSNVGLAVRHSSATDLCYPASCPAFSAAQPSTTFCSPQCPCYIGEGDCDSDADCMGQLRCVENVGANHGLPADYDVCERCPVFNASSPSTSFCTAECPCGPGEGDCDPTDPPQCMGHTTCVLNVGAQYGLPADYDVCVPIWK